MALTSAHPSSLSTSHLSGLLTWSQLPTLLALNSERLTINYNILATALRKHDIPFVAPSHGLCVFVRLAKKARTEQDEVRFYDELAKWGGVKVAQGKAFRGVDRDFGWARLRFSVPVAEMKDAVQRIDVFLGQRG
jgi:DNA-binding transcriptional MocR family regulator